MFPERDTVHESLTRCSKFAESGDFSKSQKSIAELVALLNSTSDHLISQEQELVKSEKIAFEILSEIHDYIVSPNLKQDVIDIVAFEFPSAVVKFACVSVRCLKVVENILDRFIEKCSAREMLSILCEAISSATQLYMIPGYFIPLLHGLAKVFILIQKRHYENIKVAVPVILNVLKAFPVKSDTVDIDYEDLLLSALNICGSIRSVNVNLEGDAKGKLGALLGLCAFEIMALFSVKMNGDISRCLSTILDDYSHLLRHCELSYMGLITGREVDLMYKLVDGDDSDDWSDCFSDVKLGAALVVISSYYNGVEEWNDTKTKASFVEEVQGNRTLRWKAIGMLKYIFLHPNLSWEFKGQGIRMLLQIMDDDGILSDPKVDDASDALHLSTLYTTLKGIEAVIISAPKSDLRKQSFSALKKVLSDNPSRPKFDALMALVTNCGPSSMIALYLDCVREELHKSKLKAEVDDISPFWNPSVLRFVEFVLKPPAGGPPLLPDYSDAVLSALNLFRYILITESAAGTRQILSNDTLEKAYGEWLLPLRTLVAAVQCHYDHDRESLVMSALSPVEMVVYRCIELVEEEKLRRR